VPPVCKSKGANHQHHQQMSLDQTMVGHTFTLRRLSQDGNDGNDNGQTLTGNEDDEVQEPEQVPADDSSSDSETSNQCCATKQQEQGSPITMNCSRHQFVHLLKNLLVFHSVTVPLSLVMLALCLSICLGTLNTVMSATFQQV
jgi:hypothetical protein